VEISQIHKRNEGQSICQIETFHNQNNFIGDSVHVENVSGYIYSNDRPFEPPPLNIHSHFTSSEDSEIMEESYNEESSFFSIEDAFKVNNGSASFNLVGLYHS